MLGAVHTLYAPPFPLMVKLEKYVFSILFCASFIYLISNCSDKVSCLVYYHTSWFLVGDPYDSSLSEISRVEFRQYDFYLGHVFSVKITFLGDSMYRLGHFI